MTTAVASLVLPLALGATAQATPSEDSEPDRPGPRVVVTTDGEMDDQASMHRLLLYSNELDIEAIVSSSSRWHWAGDPNADPPIPPRRWSGDDGGHDWIPALIDGGYRAVYPNLVAHDPNFADPDDLLSRVYVGNITVEGEMTKDTPGSEAIKAILLDDDPRPVSLQAWGGTNTIAAALRAIADEFSSSPDWESIKQRVSEKSYIYSIQDQDVTIREYILPEWPDVNVIINRDQFEAFAYSWAAQNPEPFISYFQKDWVAENLLKGPLMGDYPLNDNTGHWFSEGDSPSFLHAIPTGLRSFEDATYGGWGGRFVQVGPTLWMDDPRYLSMADVDRAHDCSDYPLIGLRTTEAAAAGSDTLRLNSNRVGGGVHRQNMVFAGDTVVIGTGDSAFTRTVASHEMQSSPYYITLDEPIPSDLEVGTPVVDYCSSFWPQARWAEAIQMDFAARTAWSVTPSFDDANHAPVASVPEGRRNVAVKPGQRVQLVGMATDPDGDAVEATWWNYQEAGTYPGAVEVTKTGSTQSPTWSVVVPRDAEPGQTIHLILEVTDDGAPALTRYQRVIVTVR